MNFFPWLEENVLSNKPVLYIIILIIILIIFYFFIYNFYFSNPVINLGIRSIKTTVPPQTNNIVDQSQQSGNTDFGSGQSYNTGYQYQQTDDADFGSD